MDLTADLVAPCPPATLFAWVRDLADYPSWLEIVPAAVAAPARAGDAGPAWHVTLRGRLGPLSRSKRLRMVRTVCDDGHRARFERREDDGHHHAAWTLEAVVEPMPAGGGATGHENSRLTMHLHYAGALWEPLVERLLRDEIERSRARLRALVSEGEPPRSR